MGYCFSVNSSAPLSMKDVLQLLPTSTAALGNEEDELTAATLFCPGLSNRGITIVRSSSLYEITVNTLASIDDYLLALEACKAISNLADADITAEGSEQMSKHNFEKHLNLEWMHQNAHQGIGALRHTVNEQGSEGQIPGNNIELCIGPRLLQDIGPEKLSDQELYLELVKRMLDIYLLEQKGYWIPSLYEVTGEEGKWTYTVLGLKEK